MWRNLNSEDRRRRRDERGAVLLMVMLILALISVLTLSWAQEWRTELQLAANFKEARQSRRLAEAGIYYALGKLLEGKILETRMASMDPQELANQLAAAWQGDQVVHQLKFPGGFVGVAAEDEGGKINLNRATEETLGSLFAALGFTPEQVSIMSDSIMDWRSPGEQPRIYGAKSAYYLGLDPPYVSRNGPFESVEELGWVRGFEANQIISRLGDYLTVQQVSQGVNVNTAPLPVLVSMGLPPDVAQNVIQARQGQPFKSLQEISQLGLEVAPDIFQNFGFQSSPFLTIKSTGMVNKVGGRQTIKAIVRLDASLPNSWEILSWADDFPG
ncbi:MAG TPA: type II secretion system protein GspK [Desulfobaccales bacterium]